MSLVLAIHGFYLLYRIGQPEINENVETTTKLVKQGAYHYIRHPLYASLILFSLGAFLKQPAWSGAILFSITMVTAFMTARVEEQEMLKKFGDDYEVYMTQTKMFVPGVF